jgi:hypothetical protein
MEEPDYLGDFGPKRGNKALVFFRKYTADTSAFN